MYRWDMLAYSRCHTRPTGIIKHPDWRVRGCSFSDANPVDVGLQVIENLSHNILYPFLLENSVRLIANDDGKQSASRDVYAGHEVEYILPVLLVDL